MSHRIVFLDRQSLIANLRAPSFAHDWIDYDQTASTEVGSRIRDADIVIVNKARLSAETLAQAPRLDPDIRQNIAAVFFMGGAVYVSGNLSDLVSNPENAVAEWNVYGDPLAASEVFQARLKLYLVPLDATNQVMVGREDTARWQEGGATADWAATIYDSLPNAWGVEGAVAPSLA